MDTKYKYDLSDEDAEFRDFQRFKEMFNTDFSHYISGTEFIVETSNHQWRNHSGSFEKKYKTGEDFLTDIIGQKSDFSLTVEFSTGICRVTLYSHDNPTGANFELYED